MIRRWIFLACVLFFIMGTQASAQEAFDYPFVTYSPDGRAWTIREALPHPEDAQNRENPSCWYPAGETVTVGQRNAAAIPGVGEHEYDYVRNGVVHVTCWKVAHSPGKCVHNEQGIFHGMPMGNGRCLSSYYSGWNAYCADCGRVINGFYIYASKAKIAQVKVLDLDLDYYYHCPTCGHLEQGTGFEHRCAGVSANRYQVKYMPGGGNVSGMMQPSFHTYNNSERFEGEPVTPMKTLSLNSYVRKGYVFAGWNRMPDGSGEAFADGQEILNLTEENYDFQKKEGIVYLYAQWRKVTGNLMIDPGRGKYFGTGGITQVQVGYGDTYHLVKDAITPPDGFRVQFDAMGGEPTGDVTGRMHFEGWRLESPFHGTLQGEDYVFRGESGEADRITALYQGEAIILPLPVRSGYSFGGWYFDRGFTRQAGREGDPFVPVEDVVLYADWVELVLDAKLNLECQGGKGAVDLSWHQADARRKRYVIRQKREGGTFEVVGSAMREWSLPGDVSFSFLGREEIYVVPSSGFYELTARGAQGRDVGSFRGGPGGEAQGRFFLEAGDVITVFVGGMDGSGGGGSGKNSQNGGGRTEITSAGRGLLLIAGGGGSASEAGDGGAGGLEEGLRADRRPEGEGGDVGGGAGYVGGAAGTHRVHVHTEACLHRHQGNPRTGGACYEEIEREEICHVEVMGPFIEWNKSGDCLDCIAAGRNGWNSVHPMCWRIIHHECGEAIDYGSSGYWQCIYCGHVGYKWGTGQSRPVVSDHVRLIKAFTLNCDRVYECGDPPPVVLPAFGGSNYVNGDVAVSGQRRAGVQTGNGEAFIHPVSVGFQETCELKEVYAPDMTPPMAIDGKRIEMLPAGDGKLKIAFPKPEDRGTTYYHQAESYLDGSESVLSLSNVTATNVVTGVAGYYYMISEAEHVAVTQENAENAGRLLLKPELEVNAEVGSARYLHVAPVDEAGNVGPSISVELMPSSINVQWNLVTTPIEVSSNVNGREYGSVAPADGAYFVRADGSAPFLLSFSAIMQGSARTDYQIDQMAFAYDAADGLGEGRFTAFLDRVDVNAPYLPKVESSIKRMSAGRDLLRGAMYSEAERSNQMRAASLWQSFTMDASQHGKHIRVIPSAGATYGLEIKTSEREPDERNQVILIGDGKAPEIQGWEMLERLFEEFHGQTEGLELKLCAVDELSGVKDFWLEVHQINSGLISVFRADESGYVRVDLTENEMLFSGDLYIVARAIDRVGNENVQEFYAKEFYLKTEILRLLPPHAPCFKRGESGILKILVRGYPESLETVFPRELASIDPALDGIKTYPEPLETVREENCFMIPLDFLRDGTYQVTVRARKGDEVLTSVSQFTVSDNLLGEIRTRLR